MYLCPPLFPSTPKKIIINCSFTASKLSTTLIGRNLKLHRKRCFANSTLRLPQFILMSVTLSRKEHLTVPACCPLNSRVLSFWLPNFTPINSKFLTPTLTFQKIFMSIASRKPVLPSSLLLCLLPHLLLIFLLHLTLTLVTVTGCGQLSVTDQFSLPPSFPLQGVRPSLLLIVLFFFFLGGCPHWVHILSWGLCLHFFLY